MKPVNMRWSGLALALGLALIVNTGAEASPRKHKPKAPAKKAKAWAGAENSLIGIKLYDSGLKVIDVYGTPDEIQALSFSGVSNAGPTGGGAAGPMGPGGPGMGGGPMGRPGGMGPAGGGPMGRPGGRGDKGGDITFGDPFTLDDVSLDQKGRGPAGGTAMGGPGAMGGPMGQPGGMGPGSGARGGGMMGRPGGMGPGGGGIPGAPGGGAPGGNGGVGERTTFTRWVYNREGSKFAFIIDKAGRVVQIEAIGLDNGHVKTKRGIGFGSTFASILKSYSQPDGYEIGGDNLMIKYLVHDNVAFRLTRLGTKKPQVVTGIVVAAGKS